MLDCACIVVVWVLYFQSPLHEYMYHGGEYPDRESCRQAGQLILSDVGRPGALYECWPVRKLMEE